MSISTHLLAAMAAFSPLLLQSASVQLKPGEPSAAGMSAERLAAAAALVDAEVKSGGLGAASILIARNGVIALHKGFGRFSADSAAPKVEPDSVYLVASVTKPVTATALMLLVERGRVALTDPVGKYLPEFTGGERGKVRVRDLLTHTSGLPDMLPDNTELRRSHAPLSEYAKRTYSTPLLFHPGTEYRYQSMGILLAAEIVDKLTGMPLREFERKEIFEPLSMRHTSLGLGNLKIGDTVQAWVSPAAARDEIESWGHNSPYWRNLGSPWGGMHTTTTDLAILLQTFLNGGSYGGKRILSPAAVRAMISNQNAGLKTPRGIGWALSGFGDLATARAFGHSGATGAIAWADPETQLICVVLTNRELSVDNGHLLTLISNAVAAAQLP